MSLMKSRIWYGVYRWDSTLWTMSPICDTLMLAICLKDQEDGSSPAEFWRALQWEGHEHALGNEFPQMVKRDALHVEGSSYGTKANIP